MKFQSEKAHGISLAVKGLTRFIDWVVPKVPGAGTSADDTGCDLESVQVVLYAITTPVS